MSAITLTTNLGISHIKILPGVIDQLGRMVSESAPPTSVCVVTDETVAALYLDRAMASLATTDVPASEAIVASGEKSKCLAEVEKLYGILAREGVDRGGLIVALGGGVVSDLAGFVSATWLRGVRFAACPTTMEAAVDAAIGGKTGVNLSTGKNLVGAFHQPSLIAVDPQCLRSLTERDIRAGLAESVKHAMIASEEFLTWHEQHCDEILNLSEDVVVQLLDRNIRIKADHVREDAREQTGQRMRLNFGHTAGHAIESYGRFGMRHGECVALGMLVACRISSELGLLDEGCVTRARVLLERLGLASRLGDPTNEEKLLDLMSRDKKVRGGKINWVLLEGIGKPVIRDDVPDQVVRSALQWLSQ